MGRASGVLMPDASDKMIQSAFSLDAGDDERLEFEAKRRRVPKATLVRMMICEALDQRDREADSNA